MWTRLRVIGLTSGLLVFPGMAAAQEIAAPKLRIAVGRLADAMFNMTTTYLPGSDNTTIDIPPPEDFALGLTEMLTTALVETNRFIVVERAQMDQVLAEQDLGASGRVNPETAAEVGRLIGAAALVSGGITEYSYVSSAIGGKIDVLRAVGVTARQVTAKVALDIRVLDAVTGEVLFSRRSEGSATARTASADIAVAEQEFGLAAAATTPLGQASRQAIEGATEAIVTELVDVPWTGRIIDVRGERVYVNAGAEDGVVAGMEFDVYSQEPPLIDPATGRNLGAPEEHLGSIRITVVEDQYSVAEAIESGDFARNHVLRMRGQASKR